MWAHSTKSFSSFQRTPSLRRKWRKRYGGLDGNKLLEPNKEDETRGTKKNYCNSVSFRCLVYSIDSDPGPGCHFSSGKYLYLFGSWIMGHCQIPSITTLRHWSHISRITPRSVWESFWNYAKWMGQFCRCFHLSRLVVNIWAIKMCKGSGCVLGKSDVADTKKKKRKKSVLGFLTCYICLAIVLLTMECVTM